MKRTEAGGKTIWLLLLISLPILCPGNLEGQTDEECLACHGDNELKSSDGRSVFVDANTLADSIHGQIGLGCVDCHLDLEGFTDYPHNKHLRPANCIACHVEALEAIRLSIHSPDSEAAPLPSPSCRDCHGGHDVRAIDPDSSAVRGGFVQACGTCHFGIARDYWEGIHGQALAAGNPDVAVCTECHSGHDTQTSDNQGSGVYATRVAEVCSRCHDDEVISRRYGLLTSRLRTYSASFHGTASSYGVTKVANCASCHGFHGIRRSDDPLSFVHPDNLSSTCGRCHPGAGENFAKGKIHVVSERKEHIGAFIARLFYSLIIWGSITFFLVFISSDIWRRWRER